MKIKMPGLAQHRIDHSSNNNNKNALSLSSSNGFWSKHRNDVSYHQLQKFWSELSPQARQELLRIDKQTLFEQARKNMYCSRCNGLLLEGFLQIVMYGKSLQMEGVGRNVPSNKSGAIKNVDDCDSRLSNGREDEMQDPSVHPWGGLTTTRDGSLTLLDCYLYSKSLKGLQNVFDSARARERERELLYPDACGGGGRGWISQGIASYGRGHGTRETCALHTARLSCDTLVDFWSALGEETRQSLLRMKEEDFIERLMYRFDSKRFCRDCRRNVIREFKELKELKRLRRDPRCTSWFCVADTAFQYEVSDDMVQADWHQTFADTVGIYHHFEWAVGTGEGKSDILEFENVGMNGSVQVNGLDLRGLSACFITLRAWKIDGRCTELSVKAHALKGQQCVHCRLVVGDGYVSITRGDSIRRFFEHAEEAEEEEDDDSMDKDGNELDGECSRPQKHAKSPELAREFLLDAATVIFKEQVEKAFREGTARQNAHSIFVCLALKLLEERVHVACKEIITLEKQMKLLEEEEREKRLEEERKERRRTKEREKKLRRKERLKGKERDKEKNNLHHTPAISEVTKEESLPSFEEEASNTLSHRELPSKTVGIVPSRPVSPNTRDEKTLDEYVASSPQNDANDEPDGETTTMKDGPSFTMEQSKLTRRRLKFRKDVQVDPSFKWSDRRRFHENGSIGNRSEPRYHGNNCEMPSRTINGFNRQVKINGLKPISRNCGPKFSDKFLSPNNRVSDRYDFHSCSCNQNGEHRTKVQPHISTIRAGREAKSVIKSESALDVSRQFYRCNKYSQMEYAHESFGRSKSKFVSTNNSIRDHSKKVWEPMESQKKYPRSNSDSDVTARTSSFRVDKMEAESNFTNSSSDACCSEVSGNSDEVNCEYKNLKESSNPRLGKDTGCKDVLHGEAKDTCYTNEATDEAVGDNGLMNPIANGSSISNSDNCSSCLSEGDSNTASSNNGNLESSSTSDSEDASQQSEGREASLCVQNGFSKCNDYGMDKKQNLNGEETFGNRKLFGFPQDGVGSNVPANLLTRTSQHLDGGKATAGISCQPQGILPPMHNPNIHFPVFQAPSAMGYYHQPPVSWPTAPASGFLPFHHPNHYVYAGPFGYSLNGNSNFCMQYGTLNNLTTPLFNGAPLPVYQPASRGNGLTSEEKPQISKSSAPLVQGKEDNAEKAVPLGPRAVEVPSRKDGTHESSSKLHDENRGFSLFHFGGPVALSTGHKSDPIPSNDEIIENLSSKIPEDHLEVDNDCNKKETTIEEYNLFAAKNGIRFSIF